MLTPPLAGSSASAAGVSRPSRVRRRATLAMLVGCVLLHRAPAYGQDPGRAHSLTAVVVRNAVTLQWLAPAAPPMPVVGYQIDVGLSPGTTTLSLPVGGHSFSAVAPDGVYFVRVQALTAAGPTGPSNEVRLAVGQAAPPDPPLALLASVAGNTVGLQWTENPVGATVAAYLLQAGSAPGLADIASAALPASPTSLSTPAPAGTYYVRVHAANASGVSAPSNEVVVNVAGCAPPGAPSGLAATTMPGGVALSWNASGTGGLPTGYRLLVGSTSGSANLGVFALPPATTLSSPAPAGTYFVRVIATNTCGSSGPSNEVSFIVAGPPVTSLVGTWDGQVFNHVSRGRGQIRSFVLRVDANPPGRGGLWTDNLGCKNANVFSFFSGGTVVISIESLTCNDGDFVMTVTSVAGNVVQGSCRGTCTFRMTKR